MEGLGGDWSLMGREEQVRGLLDSLEVRVRHTRGGGEGGTGFALLRDCINIPHT